MSNPRILQSSFRSGYIPSILELLNLIVSAGFFNYFSSHPVTDLQNVLEEVLDPTDARQTELYFHVIIEHARQFWIVCSNPRVSTCCWGFPRTGTVAVSSLTSVLLLPYDMECSLSDFCGCYRKAFGTAFFHPRSPMRTAWDCVSCTGCESCAGELIFVGALRPQVASLRKNGIHSRRISKGHS